jgi:Flp pilus assembly pilin Flp
VRRTAAGSDGGASAVEYALILVALAIGSIVLVMAFVRVAARSYDRTCEQVGAGLTTAAPHACG